MTINIILTSAEQTCDEENQNKQSGKLFIFDCIYFSTAQTIYFSLFILTAQPTLTPVFCFQHEFLDFEMSFLYLHCDQALRIHCLTPALARTCKGCKSINYAHNYFSSSVRSELLEPLNDFMDSQLSSSG